MSDVFLGGWCSFTLGHQVVAAITGFHFNQVTQVTNIQYFFQQDKIHDSSPGCLVVISVWQKGQETRTFHGCCQLTLILGFGTGDTAGNDLA